MKKLFVFLISLFMMNSMAGQDLIHARPLEAVAQRSHKPLNMREKVVNPWGEVLFLRGTKTQRSMIQINDSIYNWNCGLPDMEWMVDSKTTDMVYDASNNLTSETYMEWSDPAWEMRNKYNYTYDIANNLICELAKEWNGIAWDNVNQSIYSYDAWNNQISALDQEWDGISWENVYRYTYEYDNNHNQISALIQDWDSSAWVNSILETCTYDAGNNPVTYLMQLWNSSAWNNFLMKSFMYDAGNNLIYGLMQGWNGIGWINERQYFYTYDDNDNLISYLVQSWEGETWLNDFQLLYTYETNNFKLSETWYYWDDSGAAISEGDSTYYYFHMLGIDRYAASMKNITVYPNPSSNSLTIKTTSGGALTIFNGNGQAILQQTITTPTTTIDVSGLTSGVYVLKIVGEKGVQVGKVIKQ